MIIIFNLKEISSRILKKMFRRKLKPQNFNLMQISESAEKIM